MYGSTKPKLSDARFTESYYNKLFSRLQDYLTEDKLRFDFVALSSVISDYENLQPNDFDSAWHLHQKMLRVQEELDAFMIQVKKELEEAQCERDQKAHLKDEAKKDPDKAKREEDLRKVSLVLDETRKRVTLLKAFCDVAEGFDKKLSMGITYCMSVYRTGSDGYMYKKFITD